MDWHSLTDTNDIDSHVREMPRRFSGCLMMLTTANGNTYPVKYNRAVNDGHEFISARYGQIIVNMQTEVVVAPVFPEVGIYRYDDHLVYFSKRPARQWKRGVCSTNAKLVDLETNREINITEDNYSKLCAHPNKYGYRFTRFLTNSVAIDRKWGITSNGRVFFGDTEIGTLRNSIQDGIDHILSVDELFYQEAVDRFRKEFTSWQIESVQV